DRDTRSRRRAQVPRLVRLPCAGRRRHRALGPAWQARGKGRERAARAPGPAIEVGRFLEQHGVVHFEEPCPYWEPEWTAEVSRTLDLDVAGGEQDCMLRTWRRMIELRAVDIVQPDVCY